jgi:hypothetical protein
MSLIRSSTNTKPVLVDLAHVTGAEPTVGPHDGSGLVRLAEEALHQLGGPQPDLAVPTGRQVLQRHRVDDPQLHAGDRPAGRHQPLGVA